MMKHISSGVTVTQGRVLSSWTSSAGDTHFSIKPSATCGTSVMISAASESVRICSMRSFGYSGSMGINAAPAFSTPNTQVTSALVRRMRSSTRSCGLIPRSISAWPMRLEARSSSEKVILQSRAIRIVLSGFSPAMRSRMALIVPSFLRMISWWIPPRLTSGMSRSGVSVSIVL